MKAKKCENVKHRQSAIKSNKYETIKNGGSLKRKMLVIDLEFLSKKLGENARKLSLKYDWHNLSKQVPKTLISYI